MGRTATSTVGPHPWDDDRHRHAIWAAFDHVCQAQETGAAMRTRGWQITLRRLTDDAKVRKAVLLGLVAMDELVEHWEVA